MMKTTPISKRILEDLSDADIRAIIVGEVMLVADIVALSRSRVDAMYLYEEYNDNNKKLRKKRDTTTSPLQEQLMILETILKLLEKSKALVEEAGAKSHKDDCYTAREIVCRKSFIFYEYNKTTSI